MAAVYGSIRSFQRVLAADTASAAITLPLVRTAQTRILITAPAARTAPVHFLLRPATSTDDPTTVAAGADGEGSPALRPGFAVEITSIGESDVELVLKSTGAGDVYVDFYEVAS